MVASADVLSKNFTPSPKAESFLTVSSADSLLSDTNKRTASCHSLHPLSLYVRDGFFMYALYLPFAKVSIG